MCIIGAWSPLVDVIIGRRENSAILILTIVMSLFYERRVKPKRSAIVAIIDIRDIGDSCNDRIQRICQQKNWSGVQQMDLLANFQKFASEGSILELRNGAAIIEATREKQATINSAEDIGTIWSSGIFQRSSLGRTSKIL